MDSTKNLPTWGRGVSKIRKNCRSCLWMVPKHGCRGCLAVAIFLLGIYWTSRSVLKTFSFLDAGLWKLNKKTQEFQKKIILFFQILFVCLLFQREEFSIWWISIKFCYLLYKMFKNISSKCLTAWYLQILADQLTLFKPEWQIMPATLLFGTCGSKILTQSLTLHM